MPHTPDTEIHTYNWNTKSQKPSGWNIVISSPKPGLRSICMLIYSMQEVNATMCHFFPLILLFYVPCTWEIVGYVCFRFDLYQQSDFRVSTSILCIVGFEIKLYWPEPCTDLWKGRCSTPKSHTFHLCGSIGRPAYPSHRPQALFVVTRPQSIGNGAENCSLDLILCSIPSIVVLLL